ncbi:hypothetical protein [Psychrobacter lutiphocae]|uniref:hypothetical protein n=1 Tax=Psychrobacter lutiphocae TaxID=540500 RepID=UPI000381D6C4|nr:hypothetical protein [Psychrobacter lutiphocae]
MKKNIRFITLILIILFGLISTSYAWNFHQTKVIESTNMRVKVTNLIVKSKFDSFWQGQMYKDREDFENTSQSLRVEYFVAILYTLTDKLQKSGEATLIFYEIIPAEDRVFIYNKLNELERTKYFDDLEDNQKEYILSIKKNLKRLSHSTKHGD